MPARTRVVTQGRPTATRRPTIQPRLPRRRRRGLAGFSGGVANDTVPAVHVEIGAGSPPGTAWDSVSWTSITADTSSISIRRGRSTELDDFQVGTATVTVFNNERQYDPNHATGPFFGRLLDLTPIRIYARYNGGFSPLFTGYVTEWPQDYDPPTMATVTLVCVDGFEVLANGRMPGSVLEWEILQDAPHGFWPLVTSTVPSTAPDRSGNGHDGTYEGTVSSSGELTYGGDGASTFAAGASVRLPDAAALANWQTDPAFGATIEMMMSTSTPDSVDFLYFQQGEGATYTISMQTSTTYAPQFQAIQNFAPLGTVLAPVDINDGETHHLVGVVSYDPLTDTSTRKIWVDGILYTPAEITGWGVRQAKGATIAGTLDRFANNYIGTIEDVATFQTALSDERVEAHYQAATTPWDGDTTGARIARLLDVASWPTTDRDIDAGITVLGPASLGSSALTDCKAVEKTEQGRFFMSATGKATFRNRHAPFLRAETSTSQATFGDGGGTELPYFFQGFRLRAPKELIQNSITATRVGGTAILVEDAASVDVFLYRADSITGLLYETDAETRNFAEWRLDHYSEAVQRVESIVIRPGHQPGGGDSWTSAQLWDTTLSFEIGKRYTIKRRPQSVGDPITVEAICEGVEHDIRPGNDWTTRLKVSPAETGTYWVLGTSQLDTGTRLAF